MKKTLQYNKIQEVSIKKKKNIKVKVKAKKIVLKVLEDLLKIINLLKLMKTLMTKCQMIMMSSIPSLSPKICLLKTDWVCIISSL